MPWSRNPAREERRRKEEASEKLLRYAGFTQIDRGRKGGRSGAAAKGKSDHASTEELRSHSSSGGEFGRKLWEESSGEG